MLGLFHAFAIMLPVGFIALANQEPRPTMTEIKVHAIAQKPFDYSHLNASQRDLARKAAARIKGHQRAALIEIGRELLKVKEELTHGDFGKWVETECRISRRTAVNLMHVASVLGTKWESVSHLPPSLLYALSAPTVPQDFRERALNSEQGKILDIKSLKRELAEVRRKQTEANRELRRKEPTKAQQATARRKAKKELEQREQWETRELEKVHQAKHVANLIAESLGSKGSETLTSLKEIDANKFVAALASAIERQFRIVEVRERVLAAISDIRQAHSNVTWHDTFEMIPPGLCLEAETLNQTLNLDTLANWMGLPADSDFSQAPETYATQPPRT